MIDQDTSPQRNDSTPGDDQQILDAIEEVRYQIASMLRLRKHPPQDVLSTLQYALENVHHFSQKGPQIADVSISDLLQGYWAQVERRRDCAPTGFKSLNDILGGGFEAKRLAVLLGAPNSGKTTFIHQIADHIADSGRPVLYVTSEDSPHDLLSKTLARIGDVKYTAVQKGWESERAKITAALTMQSQRMSTQRLRYLDVGSGISLDIIRDKARAHFERHPDKGQGVLVVDYLQRIARAIRAMGSISLELREAVTVLTEQLRAMACELDCCVIAVASQSRASGYSVSNSSLASAKESGDIEYTADVMMVSIPPFGHGRICINILVSKTPPGFPRQLNHRIIMQFPPV